MPSWRPCCGVRLARVAGFAVLRRVAVQRRAALVVRSVALGLACARARRLGRGCSSAGQWRQRRLALAARGRRLGVARDARARSTGAPKVDLRRCDRTNVPTRHLCHLRVAVVASQACIVPNEVLERVLCVERINRFIAVVALGRSHGYEPRWRPRHHWQLSFCQVRICAPSKPHNATKRLVTSSSK